MTGYADMAVKDLAAAVSLHDSKLIPSRAKTYHVFLFVLFSLY